MKIDLTKKQVDLLRNWIDYAICANETNADPYHNPNANNRRELKLENKMLRRIDGKLFIAELMSKKPKVTSQ